MRAFVYEPLPGRIVFGAGAVGGIAGELERLGIARALVLSTPGRRALAEAVMARFAARAVGLYDGAVMHVPLEVAQAGAAEARRLGADGCVAVGGGSTVGLAKAIARAEGLPILAVPTTYAGSEMTPIWGVTDAGVKQTGRDPRVLPKTVMYDPALTVDLPARVSTTSGMNAIAHCVEALYARDGNPIVSLMAEEGIAKMAAALPRIVADPNDPGARADGLYGAWLGGAALGAVGMALHHKLCHTLGGSFGLPHAETHTVILPHVAAYNRDAAAPALARVARALDARDAAAGLSDLAAGLGAPTSLYELGLARANLDRAAELASANPYWNPRPVSREELRALLEDAYEGRPPAGSERT